MATREIDCDSLSIARMTEHDLLEVVEIEVLSGISAWGWDAYHKELQSPQDVIMLVARSAGTEATGPPDKAIAGFIVSRLVAGELHINNVAVRSEFLRRGIATGLLAAVLQEGRSNGARFAFLEVRERNAAASKRRAKLPGGTLQRAAKRLGLTRSSLQAHLHRAKRAQDETIFDRKSANGDSSDQ